MASHATHADEGSDTQPRGTALREWRAGWPLTLSAALGVSLSVMHTYSLGAFMEPIEKEMGWSRALITSGLTIKAVVAVVAGPFVGLLIDRFGPRRLGLAGVALYCAAISLLGLTTSASVVWWGLWLLLSLAYCGIQPAVWAGAVSSRFSVSRGLALGVTFCGASLGIGLLPIISEQLLQVGGWRLAYALLGGGAALVVLPLLYLFFRSRAEQDAQQVSTGKPARARQEETGLSRREAFTTSRFYRLAAGALILQVALTALTVHFVPILSQAGLARGQAVAIAGVIGVFSLIGRLTSGVLVDRLDGRVVGAFAGLFVAVALILLSRFDGSVAMATAIAAIVGLAFGAEIDVVAYLATRYFGLRNFGLLFGTVSGLLAMGSGVGPFIASFAYDRVGDYQLVFLGMAPLALLATLLVATLGKYPTFKAPEAD